MQKIIPGLWYDDQAEQAVKLYTSIFRGSKIGYISRYGKANAKISGRPEGSVLTVPFEIAGQSFIALNGGPVFKFNPSVSFLVNCKTKAEVDSIWEKLKGDGPALMDLGKYPFSERYGWMQDKFGLSWQIMLTGAEIKQKIIPTIMFTGPNAGKAEEAVKLYTSVFHDSKTDHIMRYEKGEAPDKEGTVRHTGFTLEGQEFAAMDSAHPHQFAFNEAISFLVNCESQKEIDYFWENLTLGGEEGPCGWLKDRFGLSWQVSPQILNEMLLDKDSTRVERVMEAFLKMKRIYISVLKDVYNRSSA
jgi:predicted 3-demethylubiquinone-9 3-methyltransferase (glyoxalase superfamily)